MPMAKRNDEPLERFTGKDGVEKILIRVRCYAGDVIKEQALQFSNTDTLYVSDITEAVSSKQSLTKEQGTFFGLWIVGKELSLQLRPKQDIFEIVTKWNKWNEKYTHNPKCDDAEDASNDFYFIFKREALFPLSLEKKVSEEAVIKLLYGEAHQRLLAGIYPVKVKDAASLAAIQSQILYGDYVKEKHGPGYILTAIREYVPSYILKEISGEELERMIFEQWAAYAGRSQLIGRHLYLQYLRQFPFYGSTFFPACRTLPPNGFFEQRKEHLLVGVNSSGVQIVDLDKKRVVFNQYWDNINFIHTADTLVFELKNPIVTNSKTRGSISEVSIISPQSHLINNVLVKGYITYEQEQASLENIRRKQARENKAGADGDIASQRRASRRPSVVPDASPAQPSQSYAETRRKSVQLQQQTNVQGSVRDRKPSVVNGSVRRYTLQATASNDSPNLEALFTPIAEDMNASNGDLSQVGISAVGQHSSRTTQLPAYSANKSALPEQSNYNSNDAAL